MKFLNIRISNISIRFSVYKLFTVILICIGVLIFCREPLSASEITFMTHHTKGCTYVNTNGELHGNEHAGTRAFFVELIREMMTEMNTPSQKIEDVPFKRGLTIVQETANYAFFNVARTAERENTVKWVGPIFPFQAYFYETKNAPTGIQTLEDAKKISTCVMRGSLYEKALVKEDFARLQRVTSYEQCFKILAIERARLTVMATNNVDSEIRAAKLSVNDFVKTPVMLFKKDGYIVFSKNVPDQIIKKWQEALDKIKRTGKYDLIYKRFTN